MYYSTNYVTVRNVLQYKLCDYLNCRRNTENPDTMQEPTNEEEQAVTHEVDKNGQKLNKNAKKRLNQKKKRIARLKTLILVILVFLSF